VLFKGFEIFLSHLERDNRSVFVWDFLEHRVFPFLIDFGKLFLHLSFLLRSFSGFFNIVLEVEQVEVPNDCKCGLIINLEV